MKTHSESCRERRRAEVLHKLLERVDSRLNELSLRSLYPSFRTAARRKGIKISLATYYRVYNAWSPKRTVESLFRGWKPGQPQIKDSQIGVIEDRAIQDQVTLGQAFEQVAPLVSFTKRTTYRRSTRKASIRKLVKAKKELAGVLQELGAEIPESTAH